MIEKRKRKGKMRRVRDDGFTLDFFLRLSSRWMCMCVLVQLEQKERKEREIEKKEEKENLEKKKGTGNRIGE